jgi:hypothetical protein
MLDVNVSLVEGNNTEFGAMQVFNENISSIRMINQKLRR